MGVAVAAVAALLILGGADASGARDSKWFWFLRKPRPPPSALQGLRDGFNKEDATAREYARDVCADLQYPLRDPREPVPDIIWGVLFDSEVPVLEMALHEMRGLVKAIVIGEVNVTQAGYPRAVKGAAYFEKFVDHPNYPRLVHQQYDEPRSCRGVGRRGVAGCYVPKYGDALLGVERGFRNWVFERGWKAAGARAHDIVAIADADEFLSARYLYGLRRCAWNTQPSKDRGRVRDPSCTGRPVESGRIAFLNCYFNCPSFKWYWHPNLITYRCVTEGTAADLRKSPRTARWHPDDVRTQATRLEQAGHVPRMIVGWHARNFFTMEDEQRKYKVYGHPRHVPMEQITAIRKGHCSHDTYNERGHTNQAGPMLNMSVHEMPLLAAKYPERFSKFFYPSLDEWRRGRKGAP
eukprot:Hpha_TRINITY_DN31118_c0_g1::TRINITY_DN31118_c0_g1_i1::g.33064::m.33064/K00737/MGAT3; beta-1,4-mannosyl-glycoprotein beta-1,4-N-acetylglucosaminyltransferase